MSHDRGCFECGRDRWNYEACAKENGPDKCVKYDLVFGKKETKKMVDYIVKVPKDSYQRTITDHTPDTKMVFHESTVKIMQDTSYNQIEITLTNKQAIEMAQKILDRLTVKV